jgi:hypothetical protein
MAGARFGETLEHSLHLIQPNPEKAVKSHVIFQLQKPNLELKVWKYIFLRYSEIIWESLSTWGLEFP